MECGQAQDTFPLRELMREDAEFWTAGRDGTLRCEDLIALSAAALGDARRHGITVVGTPAEGERVAVEAQGDFELADEAIYNNLHHFLFVIRDGKFTSIREYMDTALAARTIGGGT